MLVTPHKRWPRCSTWRTTTRVPSCCTLMTPAGASTSTPWSRWACPFCWTRVTCRRRRTTLSFVLTWPARQCTRSTWCRSPIGGAYANSWIASWIYSSIKPTIYAFLDSNSFIFWLSFNVFVFLNWLITELSRPGTQNTQERWLSCQAPISNHFLGTTTLTNSVPFHAGVRWRLCLGLGFSFSFRHTQNTKSQLINVSIV